jgi:sulfoxide reductase heme-binding subunit YedZ
MLLIVVTSLLRTRLRPRTWRLLHQLAWPMWGLSIAHGIGLGTDLRDGWWLVSVGCVVAVVFAALCRIGFLVVDHLPAASGPGSEPADESPPLPQTELRVLR